ncbi:MAG: 4Fe-4S dicluster domain-containing protein [Bacteroidota bacterium]
MAKQWGYGINKDRQIDLDGKDMRITQAIILAEPTIDLCISCGSCAATCSASNFTSLSLRHIILKLKRGEYQGLAEEISRCMLCGKCNLACPRNVNTRNLILQIQKSLENHGRN